MHVSELACEITARRSLSLTLTRSGCERTWQLRRDACGWTYRVMWPGHVVAGGLPDPAIAVNQVAIEGEPPSPVLPPRYR